MISIVKSTEADLKLLVDIGRQTFIESHGRSVAAKDISKYVNEKYNDDVFREDLSDSKNIYHIIYHAKQAVGYSKIILNVSHSNIREKKVTKLDRLYLLQEFYGLKSGHTLFKFNLDLSQQGGQEGMWLFVWKENHRAVI